MSARAAAVEALRALELSIGGAPWATDVLRLIPMVPPVGGEPDPLVLRALRFLAGRVRALREAGDPWLDPSFRLFSEAFMLSSEFSGALARGLSLVKPRPGSAAVDVMSCTGVCLEQAAPHWGRLIAVDPSPLNLELVEERLRGVGAANFELLVGGVDDVPRLVREPVGLVILASPSAWLTDLRSAVSRAYSTLEPGGQLLVVAPIEREGLVSPLAPFIVALGGQAPPGRGRFEDLLLAEGYVRVRFREGDLLTAVVATKP